MASGIWSSWGTTMDCAIMPNPIATAARFVISTGGWRGGAQVDQRVVLAELERAPRRGGRRCRDDGAPGRAAVPAPGAALGDADEEGGEADRQADGPGDVEASGRPVVHVRHGEPGQQRDHRSEGGGHPEQGVPVTGVGDPGGRAGGRWRRPPRGWRSSWRPRCAAISGGANSRMKRDADRDEAHRHALQRATGQHGDERAGQCTDHGPDTSAEQRWRTAPAACRRGRRCDRRQAS